MNKKFSKILLIFICLFVFMMLYGCKKEVNDEAITSNKVLVERYSVSYYVDGELYWKKTYKVGAAIEQIEEPTKEGYTFKGWNKSLPKVMGKEDIVVSAVFEVNKYKITYVLNDEKYKEVKYNYGDTIENLKVSFDEDKYYFSGWSNVSKTMPANDIVVTGSLFDKENVNLIDLGDLKNSKKYDIIESGFYLVYGSNQNVGVNIVGSNLDVTLLFSDVDIKNNNLVPFEFNDNSVEIILLNDTDNSIVYTNKEVDKGCINTENELSISGRGILKLESSYQGIDVNGDINISGCKVEIISQEEGIKTASNINFQQASIDIDSLNCGLIGDSIKFDNCNIDINSKKTGIKGDDVVIDNSLVEIISSKNSIECNNDLLVQNTSLIVESNQIGLLTKEGSIIIKQGEISIISLWDAILSHNNIVIDDNPTITILSGGGLNGEFNYDEDGNAISCKGLYAYKDIVINSGQILIESLDKCIISNGKLELNGGLLNIKSKNGE